MKILRTVSDLQSFSRQAKAQGKSLGLVPTMGALHAGHISLMKEARKGCDTVVASVFVNPTQFNNKEDLATYPRTEEADCRLLEKAGVDAAFIPAVEEVYPADENAAAAHVFDLGEVAEVMEGAFRPGHFQGVAQIVSRLMRWANPDRAYFGEKDFQQIAVIRRMVSTEKIPVEIVACPILREADGLALSSRNVRLSAEARNVAPGIYRTLRESVEYSQSHSVEATRSHVESAINALPLCEVEYFAIVDSLSMQPVSDWNSPNGTQGCVTVYCGGVRLIDNINYRSGH